MPEIITFNKRVLKAPYLLLAALLVYVGVQQAWWLFFGMPMIYLGWAGSTPNLSPFNGCLPLLLSLRRGKDAGDPA